jgi:hypothetical protein
VLILSFRVTAQIPQGINYQAVARDGAGNPLANKNVSVRISINDGIAPGNSESVWFVHAQNRHGAGCYRKFFCYHLVNRK